MSRPLGALTCPRCGCGLTRTSNTVTCCSGHRFPARHGYIDLVGDDLPDSTAGVFDGPYGVAYDFGVSRPALAGAVARALWGADLTPMYKLMDRGLAAPSGHTVVDVPVGGAPVLQRAHVLRCGYIGLDLSTRMLQHAAGVAARRGFDDVLLARADATQLPLRDGSIDRILCFNGLHVIPDKPAVIAEFARVLKPGGEIFGSVLVKPAHIAERLLRPWTSGARWFFHPADADDLRALAHASGFSRWSQTQSGALLLIRGRAA